MVMSDLYSSFQEKLKFHNSKCCELREAAHYHERRASELREQADQEDLEAEKIWKEIDALPLVAWPEKLVYPLAKELSRRSSKKNFTVIGPGGLSCSMHIVLHNDPEYVPIMLRKETYLELTVQPDNRNGFITLRYETGDENDSCPKGSIGQIGGLNRVTASLPDSIEEIEKLLRPSGPVN